MHSLNLIETARPGSDYTRAGRTDKGVSAMGNVVALKMRTKIKKAASR
jgi:tRNA pseudouridine(38-40) synthase